MELEPFPDDGDEHVDANGDPDLGLHGVLGGAEEALDAQVLLDPFEEQLDLPATAIKVGDSAGRQLEIVGEENESLAVLGIAVTVNRYDPWGVPGPANAGRFQYTGQAWLAELGMYHYKARIYWPTIGRFLQTDPIGYDDQINLYAYVGNDPVNFNDPDGFKKIPTCISESVNGCVHIEVEGPDKEKRPPPGSAAPVPNLPGRGTVKPSFWQKKLICVGNATFSAVGPLPQAAGDSAISPGTKPANGTVAIAGATTFGFGRQALREGAGAAIKIYPIGLGDILQATGGPSPPYSVSDYGDANIRSAPGTRFDLYRFSTLKGARQFGLKKAYTITIVPAGGHCSPGTVGM